MHKDIQKTILSRLAKKKTKDKKIDDVLDKEYSKILSTINENWSYDIIEKQLELLDAFVFRMSDAVCEALNEIFHRLENEELYLNKSYQGYQDYYNNSLIQVKVIQLLGRLKYSYPNEIINILFPLTLHKSEKVNNTAVDELRKLAEFDIQVFEALHKHNISGVWTHLCIIEHIEKLDENDVIKYQEIIFSLLTKLLNTEMSGHVWDYNQVEIQSGSLPFSTNVKELRQRALSFAIKMYNHDDDRQWKINCIETISAAANRHYRSILSEEVQAVVKENTIEVLNFFLKIANSDDLPIVHKITYDTFWIYIRSNNDADIDHLCLSIEKIINENDEYQVYRYFLGTNSIEEGWEENKKNNKVHVDYKTVNDRAVSYVEQINSKNWDEWKKRIISYIKIEDEVKNNLGGLYEFMMEFAKVHYDFAYELIDHNDNDIKNYISLLLINLYKENPLEIDLKIAKWMDAKQHIAECSRFIGFGGDIDKDLFHRVYIKCTEIEVENIKLYSLENLMRGLFNQVYLHEFFQDLLNQFSSSKDIGWVRQVYFRSDIKDKFSEFNDRQINAIIDNLMFAESVDYEISSILSLIEERNSDAVLEYFKLRSDYKKEADRSYEAFPFDHYKIGEIFSKNPEKTLKTIRSWYKKGNFAFEYEFGGFVKNIFLGVEDDFKNEIIKYIQSDDEEDIEFVLNILKRYDGNEKIYPLCKEVVKVVSEDSKLLDTVKTAIWNSGVVSGEFGMANSLRRKVELIGEWVSDDNQKVKNFAMKYQEDLNKQADYEKKRAEEEIKLRKFQYGHSLDDDEETSEDK